MFANSNVAIVILHFFVIKYYKDQVIRMDLPMSPQDTLFFQFHIFEHQIFKKIFKNVVQQAKFLLLSTYL